tara:strand:- start:1631 stop:4624 length:2994 start_codon:yes stop_codon:yes gene_type:complete
MIPLERGSAPANDLVYQGQLLYPEQASQLVEQSGGQFDLSRLDPIESTLWQNNDNSDQLNTELPIRYMDTVDYLSSIPSRLGVNFRFSVRTKNAQTLTLMASKTVHNVLMRRALLLKLGYKVPAIKYLSKVKIDFPDNTSRERFKNALNEGLLGDTSRWVAHEEEGAHDLILQDVIAMSAEDEIYNLALGNDLAAIGLGRRVINSLVLPFAVMNVPESVNLLNWAAARVVSNHVLVELDKSTSFNCSFEDALWMFRRMERLTRADWQEITDSSNLPASVKAILVEKLIARRNSIGDSLKVDYAEIAINANPDNAAGLDQGRITQEEFEGYARRFSYGDPESPLSSSELSNYILSVGLSSAIDAAVSGINSLPFLGTDISGKNEEQINTLIEEATAESLESGSTSTDLPLSTWIFPTFQGGLQLSRNIVAGNYLGTDNLIQLVDNIGVNVRVGAFVGVAGLAPVSIGAQPNAYFTRNYAHVRPLYGIAQALKYPFKNMLVPMLKRKIGHILDGVEELPDGEEGDGQLEKVIAELKDNLEIGESFLITDSIGAGIGVFGGLSFYNQLLRVDAGVTPSASIISRLHIFRKDEDTFQVYKDLGNIRSVMVTLSLSAAGIPVISASKRYSHGSAKTKFFDLNLKKLGDKTKVALAGFRDALLKNSAEALRAVVKPFKLEHKFKESEGRAGIFWIRMNKTKSSNYVRLETPSGEVKEMFRRYDGAYKGNDYAGYGFDVVKALASKLLKTSINFSGGGGGNPGYSFLGKAQNRIMSFESVKGEKGFFDRPFVKFSRVWNGWSLKKRKALKILEDIKERYLFGFFPRQVLAQTDRLFLYNINVNFLIHPQGVEAMEKLSREDVNKIFRHYSRGVRNNASRLRQEDRAITQPARKFLRLLDKALEAKADGDVEEYSDQILKAMAQAEEELNIYGLKEMFGGEANFYSFARIDGFREGDENGDQAIVSHSLGEFGREGMEGPLASIREKTNMTEGEFLISWILRRVL